MKPKIFLFSGKARHGKGSASGIIKEIYEQDFGKDSLEINFGDYLKDLARRHFGWDGNKDEKGRTLLQYLGTDVVRKNNPDLWVNTAIGTILGLHTEFDLFTISDVRFPNEIEKPKKELSSFFDIYSVRVIRTNFITNLTKEQQNHISETALDDYDFDFYLKAKDLKELKKEIEIMLKNIN
jgi:hypothetical protein